VNNLLKNIFDSLFLFRPTLMVPVWTVFMFGSITGVAQKPFSTFIGGDYHFWVMFALFTAVVGYIYIFNQIKDIDGDRENGKLFILPEGHLSILYATVLGYLSLIIALIGAYILLDLVSFIIILLAAIMGYLYNFDPISLKDRPWGGMWANWFGHGVLTYFAGWYVVNYGATGSQLIEGALFSLSAGFANGAVYLTSTVADAKGDKEVGKITFAVAFGGKKTAFVASIMVTISLFAAFLITHQTWVMVTAALMSTILFWHHYLNFDESKTFQTFRYPVLFLSVVTSIYMPIYAVLVIAVVLISKIYYKVRFNLDYPSFKSE
jgi:4-hydroxybenzoate polyprenyltransferase